MIRLFIVLLLLSNNVAATWHLHEVHKTQVNNLTVSIIGDYKVEVNRDNKHKFSFDCSQFIKCGLFVTNEKSPEYEYVDGFVQPSETVYQLSIENIEKTLFGNADQTASYLAFVVSEASDSGNWGQTTHYRIDTETGAVLINKREWDWLKFGMPKP